MPRGSRKRYPPEPVDITAQANRPMLNSRLNEFLTEWRSYSPEQRRERATQRLEYVQEDLNPEVEQRDRLRLLEQDENWHLDEQRIESAIEDALPIPSIRFQRFPIQPELAPSHPNYRPKDPDRITVSTIGGANSALVQQVMLRFLEWFYDEVAKAPETLPELAEMEYQLIAATSAVINQAYFEVKKMDELDILAYAITQSLTGASPDNTTAGDMDYDIFHYANTIAGNAEYDPFSIDVVHKMVEAVAQNLRGGGVGAYSVEQLRKIFEPKELVVLEACARHWRNEDSWPWSEVLKHTELGKIITESTITKLAMSIREKLINNPDLMRSLLAT